jgi:hypothetical protein
MAYRLWPKDWIAAQSGSNQDATVQYQSHTAFIGTGKFAGVGVEELAEVVMIVPWLKDEICIELNRLVKNPNPENLIGAGYWWMHHLGPHLIREPPMHIDGEIGYRSRCDVYDNGPAHVLTNINAFAHVLIAR